MFITRQQTVESREARLRYRTLHCGSGWTLLEVELETGRKHQIRLQLSHRGWPILGDRKYGSQRSFPAGVALHSRRIRFAHPVRDTELDLVAPTPESWKSVGFHESASRSGG